MSTFRFSFVCVVCLTVRLSCAVLHIQDHIEHHPCIQHVLKSVLHPHLPFALTAPKVHSWVQHPCVSLRGVLQGYKSGLHGGIEVCGCGRCVGCVIYVHLILLRV